MNKMASKFSRLKQFLNGLASGSSGKSSKAGLSAGLVALLALGNLTLMASPAHALSVDVSASTFNFAFPTNGTLISGASKETSGSVVKFSNITGTPVNGVSIDAIVTMTLSSSTILTGSSGSYDSPGKADAANTNYFQVDTSVTAAYGYAEFKYDFYESGSYTGPNTGIPVVLNNLSVTTIDMDGNGYCQYTDFTGFQKYFLGTGSVLQVRTHATHAAVPVGVTRFFAGSCTARGNLVQDAAQVQFDSTSTFTARVGSDISSNPNYFGIAFKPLSAIFGGSQPAGITNPSNQPPTSTNSTRWVTNAVASVIQLADFGTFADPDSNPFVKVQITALPTSGSLEKFVNGSWIAVSVNDEILVSDITNGTLRFTGAADTSLQFKVSDGNTYSTNAYTMTLNVSDQPQTITFNNPGTKTPTTPAFASGATSNSGLTVTLTSLTPGVCTVSGLNIVPVAAGTCTIVSTQAGNRSFSAATPVTQTFPISTLTAQTITAPNPGDQTYSGTNFTITRTPTATSGLTVTMVSLSPSVCTVSGLVITVRGPGNCTIRNTQAGNGTYAAAPPVEYTFAVSTAVSNFTLTYNGNNKDSGTVPTAQTGNGNISLATNIGILGRSGYTFNGWNTAADGTGTHYNVGATYNLTADATLYAQWAAAVYTLTYDGNGKTGGSVPTAATGNGSVTLANNTGTLVRTGYTFNGWNTAANGTGTHYATADPYSLSADVTLYAEWLQVFTITYVSNGSTGGNVPTASTGNNGVTVNVSSNSGNLVRTGYSFTGWNTAANGTGTGYESADPLTLNGNVTLYAQWAALSFTITYDDNGSTGGSVPANTTGFGTKTLASNSGILAKTGYIFRGWNTQADGSGTRYLISTSYSLLADITLYAEWTSIPAVIYSANGATGGTTPGDVPAGSPITIDPNTGNLIRAGFRFLGWNTQPDGSGTRYAAGMTPVLPEGTTLYAEWEPTSSGLANTGGEMAPVLPVGLGMLLVGTVLATLRKRVRKH